ncbi:MAG: hypothetical protein ACKOA8_00765, partial [Deltaproteobacteria bacterium]
LFFIFVSSITLSSNETDYLSNQTFLDSKTAEKKWGSKVFSPEEFKKGSVKLRAQMAASLLNGKLFQGKKASEIKTALGPFTGHFWSSSVPAYLIEEGWTLNSDSWQLVFLLDNSGKVKEIRIHKNCCK